MQSYGNEIVIGNFSYSTCLGNIVVMVTVCTKRQKYKSIKGTNGMKFGNNKLLKHLGEPMGFSIYSDASYRIASYACEKF